MWCPRNDITNSRELSKDIVGSGGPGEGPRAGVVGGHEGGDASDQILGAGEGATADLAVVRIANQRSTWFSQELEVGV